MPCRVDGVIRVRRGRGGRFVKARAASPRKRVNRRKGAPKRKRGRFCRIRRGR
jgi:hypothetical protein